MKIGVIIPVVQREMYNQLMDTILRNTLRPNCIVVIDNSQYGVVIPNIPRVECHLIRNEPRKDENGAFIPGNGTNEAWKQGMVQLDDKVDIIIFLNDDTLLNPLFFEKTYQTFMSSSKLGYLIPTIHGDKDFVLSYNQRPGKARLRKTKERNGCAMALRRTLLNTFPPIPDGMTIWYGDNWFTDLTAMKGFHRLMRIDNPVFHYGGTTSKQETRRITAKVNSKRRCQEHDVFLRAIRKLKQEKEAEELNNGLKKLEDSKKHSSRDLGR